MPRRKRPLDRREAFRDARLVVIASEDTYAVEQYFSGFSPCRVQYRVLSTTDACSSFLKNVNASRKRGKRCATHDRYQPRLW